MTWGLGAVGFLEDKCLVFRMGLGLAGLWKVSEREGHVKCSPPSRGSGQLFLGQQELLLSDTRASASSPATTRLTVVRRVAQRPKPRSNARSAGANSAQGPWVS